MDLILVGFSIHSLTLLLTLYRLTQLHPTFTSLLALYLLAINALTCLLYYYDKYQSRIAGWRISELQLHLLELLGGWSTSWLSQRLFRHKIRKQAYQVIFCIIGLWQELVLVDVVVDGAFDGWIYRGLEIGGMVFLLGLVTWKSPGKAVGTGRARKR
jgi:uncharacterized membrane protein YsdA (DUF1294 family)